MKTNGNGKPPDDSAILRLRQHLRTKRAVGCWLVVIGVLTNITILIWLIATGVIVVR